MLCVRVCAHARVCTVRVFVHLYSRATVIEKYNQNVSLVNILPTNLITRQIKLLEDILDGVLSKVEQEAEVDKLVYRYGIRSVFI